MPQCVCGHSRIVLDACEPLLGSGCNQPPILQETARGLVIGGRDTDDVQGHLRFSVRRVGTRDISWPKATEISSGEDSLAGRDRSVVGLPEC